MGSAASSFVTSASSRSRVAPSARTTVIRVRPPQHWPISGPSGTSSDWRIAPRASSARAASIAMYSSCPPPIVPSVRFSDTSIQAPASRGVEPLRALYPHQHRRPLVEEGLDRLAPHRHHRPPRRFTAISTRSGVAGASSRGHSR